MSDYEFYSLIVNAIAAIGTLVAVGVSLWLASGRIKKFSIKDIKVSANVRAENPHTPYESFMYVTFENHQSVQMEIGYVELVFHGCKEGGASHIGWGCKKEFIPPLSRYDLPIKLEQGWAYNSLRTAEEITLSVKTSFGDKTVKFPLKYKGALCLSLEIPKPEDELKEAA